MHLWWNQHRPSQGNPVPRNTSYANRIRNPSQSLQPRELEFQFFIRQTETMYPPWWTREGAVAWFRNLPDDTLWNCYICGIVLLGLLWTVAQISSIYVSIVDMVYNISYAIHVFAIGYKIKGELENTDITFWIIVEFLVDIITFAHYVQTHNPAFKLGAYYVRLHRPYKYLGSLTDYNLKGSILGTTLKYCYIFMVLRITWAYVWQHVSQLEATYYLKDITKELVGYQEMQEATGLQDPTSDFLTSVYIISKMFIPIGPPMYPNNDEKRIVCILIMMTGCLITGAAVASLSLIISLYMRPEETFRARYRLIMKEMLDTRVPPALRVKVETFYKMYWHKQRAVSQTQLLPTFPPTLPATINIDIYFEATQKTRILRESTYQMLSELAKKMQTVHYIPGDAIIKRGSKKSKIIYITYGDVEMLTAEDDNTAILRMTRGTVLAPCGGAVAEALSVSHLAVRAATFCTTHELSAPALWKVVNKHSVSEDHAGPILAAFTDHVERVKRHYNTKIPDQAIHKSSILQFNRHMLVLKSMKDANGQPLLASPDIFLEIAGCYIMRNTPVDATLTNQSDEICLRPRFPCILQPSSSLLIAWNAFVAFLILLCCFTHPYNLVFTKELSLEFRFFDVVVTVVFILDHIVYLSTGANVEEGVPITFTQTSSQQMRSHWFVLDVVATLPVFEFIGDGHFAGINKLLRLPKLFRVLKSFEESCVYRSNVLRFMSYTLLLLIACYLIAALQQGVMCFTGGYCVVTNFTHAPYWEQKPLDSETIASRLQFCLYWSISMVNFTIHRQSWVETNWKHVIYTLVILEICIVLRIFMEAVYSATIMVTTALREDYGSRIEMVKSFMIRNEVDPVLRKRFINYLQLCWHTDMAYKITHKKHSNIFHDLPEHVYQDIVGRHRSNYILVIPFMKLITKEDLKTIMASVKLFYSAPNEVLLNTGELTNEIYIIKKGICEIIDPVTQKSIGKLTTKTHFGALICLLRLPAYYTIRAITHVQVMCIPRKALVKAMATPQIVQAVHFVKKTPEFHRLQTPIPAFVTYEPPPPTSNLMHFRLPRKHEPDSEFLNPFDRLGFLSILRYIFPRFTIRPDGKYLLRHEWFRVTCAMCSMLVFPHYTYLGLQWPFLYYVTFFLDLSAYFDIFQRMLIGYFNDNGILVYHPASTAAYYLKGGFTADFFGCLPLENLESTHLEVYEDMFRMTPMKQFLMLNRLIQLYRVPSVMGVLKGYIERRDILMVMQAIPLFMAMLNVLTCFMVYYSVKIYYRANDDGGYSWSIQPFADPGGSWLDLFRDQFRFNMTSTPWNLHLATYFWVVYECSSTGYGMFNPSNVELMKVLFIGMVSTAMIITYYLVSIISVRSNVNQSLAGFQQHMKDITVYMAREKLNPELQKELKRYYEYNWEKMGGIDYRGVLKLCDQITLRTDAILHIYGPTFTKCPILVNGDVSLLRILGRAVRSVYFLRDMTIIERDDMVTDVYFVDYGGVEVWTPAHDNDTETMNTVRLPKGSVFGNLEGTPAHRSPYDVVATSRLHLLMIKSQAFADITKDFPAVKELIAKAREDTGDYPEQKDYILGGEAKVTSRRPRVPSSPPSRKKSSMIKYIYFQEGLVQIYLIVVCMTCIYLDLYNAGYQDNSMWLLITLYSLDFGFFLKIFTQHALPFLVTNHSMKTIMMPIRRLYFTGEFRYDLVSITPFELFALAASTEDFWWWFNLLRLNRMFRILTVHKCLRRRNESITVNLIVMTVTAVFIWFTLFVHTTTCIWHFMAVLEDQLEPNSSWIHVGDGTTHCNNYYLCSLYFVITTFTQNGVGDILPKKHSEVVFVAVLQIISTMVFMIYVGEFSNIIQYQSYRSFSFYSKYLELQEFMQNNRVSRNLVTIVNKYTLHLWRENRGLQIPHFLKYAPLSLRLRVMSGAYLPHISRHQVFEDCEPAFLRQMVGCLKLYNYNEGMYVVKESEITDAMYMMHTGKVRETCEDMESRPRVYPAGSYFGILQGLLRNTPYTNSYQTTTKSQVLTLKLDDWEYLLKHFPYSKTVIHKHLKQLGDKDRDERNWPGGAPDTEKPEDDLLSKAYHDSAVPSPQHPGSRRQSPRQSTADDEINKPPTTKKQTRYFAWPKDRRKESHELTLENREEDQIEVEEKPKLSFMRHIANTAKKLMGKVSVADALAESEGKDELLLEEDAEATEALLAQFEKAKKKEQDLKRVRARRRNIFYPREEESEIIEKAEKHLFTLDMSDSKSDERVDEPHPFLAQSRRSHDEEETGTEMKPGASEVQIAIDISEPRTEDETKKVTDRAEASTSAEQAGPSSAGQISDTERQQESLDQIQSSIHDILPVTPDIYEPEADMSLVPLKTLKGPSFFFERSSQTGMVDKTNAIEVDTMSSQNLFYRESIDDLRQISDTIDSTPITPGVETDTEFWPGPDITDATTPSEGTTEKSVTVKFAPDVVSADRTDDITTSEPVVMDERPVQEKPMSPKSPEKLSDETTERDTDISKPLTENVKRPKPAIAHRPKISEAMGDDEVPTTSGSHGVLLEDKPTFDPDNKEEGTSTKMNRRYIHVRYEPEESDKSSTAADTEEEGVSTDVTRDPATDMTLDSDEPLLRTLDVSDEDDETSPSTSTSGNAKKGKPAYKRETMD